MLGERLLVAAVWGAWVGGCSLARAPHIFFMCCVSWRSAGRALVLWHCLRAHTRVAPLDSLYGLLTRFQALTLPRVRFASVWPSAGRTVRLVGVWRFLRCSYDSPV